MLRSAKRIEELQRLNDRYAETINRLVFERDRLARRCNEMDLALSLRDFEEGVTRD